MKWSRRIAWPIETKASEETFSGSAKRMVISVIAAATWRISCERRMRAAKTKKLRIGSAIAATIARKKGCS
jgi:hypothetical protein